MLAMYLAHTHWETAQFFGSQFQSLNHQRLVLHRSVALPLVGPNAQPVGPVDALLPPEGSSEGFLKEVLEGSTQETMDLRLNLV